MVDSLTHRSSPVGEWVSYGENTSFFQVSQLEKAPHLITQSSVKRYHQAEQIFLNLPASGYTIAPMQYSDIVKGLRKYYHQPGEFSDINHFLSLVIEDFDLEISPLQFQHEINETMHAYLPNFSSSFKLHSNDRIINDALNDPSGEARKKTSCGYGFTGLCRKKMVTQHKEDVIRYLDTWDPSHSVNFTLFLKDEIRERGKETRSIAVPQFHLWLVFRKYLGWIYDYMTDGIHPFSYGHTPDEVFFTKHLHYFNQTPGYLTHSIDFKKMDSRMSHIFISWFENFILTQTNFPVEHIDALQWIHNQSFFEKQLVDPKGAVLTFSNGELSGFPGTIIYNCFYALFAMVVSQVVQQRSNRDRKIVTVPLQILGDDIIFQEIDLEVVDRVAVLLGHELYKSSGDLFDDLSFLSYKFHLDGHAIQPYYSNLDKMFASLRYYKSEVTYFQKIASFHSLLTYAPKGSFEDHWREVLENVCIQLIDQDDSGIYTEVLASFRPSKVWRSKRDYITPSILGIYEWEELYV